MGRNNYFILYSSYKILGRFLNNPRDRFYSLRFLRPRNKRAFNQVMIALNFITFDWETSFPLICSYQTLKGYSQQALESGSKTRVYTYYDYNSGVWFDKIKQDIKVSRKVARILRKSTRRRDRCHNSGGVCKLHCPCRFKVLSYSRRVQHTSFFHSRALTSRFIRLYNICIYYIFPLRAHTHTHYNIQYSHTKIKVHIIQLEFSMCENLFILRATYILHNITCIRVHTALRFVTRIFLHAIHWTKNY